MHRVMGLNILLVEDEAFIALDVGELLVQARSNVVGPFARVEDALAALDRHQVDCAVLDINLGHERSLRVADELSARDIPFLWMSGYTNQVLPRYQDRPFLSKPFSGEEFLAAIDQIVRGDKAR